MASERGHLALPLGSTCRTPPFQPDTSPHLPVLIRASTSSASSAFSTFHLPCTPHPTPPQLLASLSPCIFSLRLLLKPQVLQLSSFRVWISFPQHPLCWPGYLDELFSFTSGGKRGRLCHPSSQSHRSVDCLGGWCVWQRVASFHFLIDLRSEWGLMVLTVGPCVMGKSSSLAAAHLLGNHKEH